MQAAQALGATRRGSGNTGQSLGKGPARTSRNGAAEPPGLDAQRDRTALPGQVAKLALVPAMDAVGRGAAEGASRRRRARLGGDGDAARGAGPARRPGPAGSGAANAWTRSAFNAGGAFLLCAHPAPKRRLPAREVRGNPKFSSQSQGVAGGDVGEPGYWQWSSAAFAAFESAASFHQLYALRLPDVGGGGQASQGLGRGAPGWLSRSPAPARVRRVRCAGSRSRSPRRPAGCAW